MVEERKFYIFAVLVLAVSLSITLIFNNNSLTGYATSDSQVGNLSASVQTYMACTWSDSTLNVDFGSLLNPGTSDIEATQNDILAPGTGYNVTVSPISTSEANITILGNDLIDGANIIGIGNVTYAVSSTDANDAAMIAANSVSITTEAVNIDSGVSPGTTEHHRFWLDIPTGVVAGNYVGNYTIECTEA